MNQKRVHQQCACIALWSLFLLALPAGCRDSRVSDVKPAPGKAVVDPFPTSADHETATSLHEARRSWAARYVADASPEKLAETTAPLPTLSLPLAADERAPAEEQGLGYLDPGTGKITWKAYTCKHADCQGKGTGTRPFVFFVSFARAVVREDGIVDLPNPTPEERRKLLGPECPACQRRDRVQAYVPPLVAERREALVRQLAISREAYHRAKRNGEPPPAGMRLPQSIMRDITELPHIYLLPVDLHPK